MENLDFLNDALFRIARIRLFEQVIWDLSREKAPAVVGSVHLCAGQEAVPVGALAGLSSSDQVISTYRGHGWALEAGLTLDEVMGEICHKTVGINQGRGGSAYMMAPHRRFIGENSIVGAGVPIACGVAMANVREGNDNVVVVSIGDGAMNQGGVSEAMSMAVTRNLPVIIICENNGWAEMTKGSVVNKQGKLTRRAASFGIQAFGVDGTNPLAVRDTVRAMAAKARQGGGPAFIECSVPRMWGHYNRDIEHYRTKSDRKEAAERDPVVLLRDHLINSGQLSETRAREIIASAEQEVEEAKERVLASPALDPTVADLRAVIAPSMPVKTGRKLEAATEMTYAQAANAAMREALEDHEEVLIFGEDVGYAGGIFGVTRYLQKDFGEERVFDTPIAETAMLGSAVGAAVMGQKPIVEIMWADFMLVALDQLINQAANIRSITAGRSNVPMVMRTQQGATPGSCAQHSQCLEALLTHVPGLKVGLPGTAQDAYDMLRAAIADPDPCLLFEAREFYLQKQEVALGGDPDPVGTAKLYGEGKDLSIITWSTMVPVAQDAAARAREEGYSVSVLDLRWLAPMDMPNLLASVRAANGKAIILHEANMTGGFGAEVMSRLYENLSSEMTLSLKRIAMPDVRVPSAPQLMASLRPNAEMVLQEIHTLCGAKTAELA